MAAINQNFTMYMGDDKQLNFTILDEAGATVSLENSAAIWVMVNMVKVPTTPVRKTTEDGGITHTGNIYHVFIDSDDTLTILPGKYQHELRMTNSDGKESVVASGEVIIYPSYTLIPESA